jgi:hypothetical protein
MPFEFVKQRGDIDCVDARRDVEGRRERWTSHRALGELDLAGEFFVERRAQAQHSLGIGGNVRNFTVVPELRNQIFSHAVKTQTAGRVP